MKSAIYALAIDVLSETRPVRWFYENQIKKGPNGERLQATPLFIHDEKRARRFDDPLLAVAWAEHLSRSGFNTILCILAPDPKLEALKIPSPQKTEIPRVHWKPVDVSKTHRFHQ